MVEVALALALPDLVKVIHVELSKTKPYLSDKGGVVAMLEVKRQDLLGEPLLADDDKANVVWSPSRDVIELVGLG